MRGYGQYFPDVKTVLDRTPADDARAIIEFIETATEEKNYRENTAKIAAGNGPQVIAGPDSAPTAEDARAIVARVAHAVLQTELNWEAYFLPSNPAFLPLQGLTREQIETAILEALR